MKLKPLYIDLDDTAADFQIHSAFNGQKPNKLTLAAMYEPGFFLSLEPIKGSLKAIRQLIALGYDVQFLSQPVAESAHSYSEKVQWVGMHFPELIGKINLTQDKGNFVGSYLIDDNPDKWKDKFEANGGKFIHFNYMLDHEAEWEYIVWFLTKELK